MLTHKLPSKLLNKVIRVLLVGAGGTGSRVLEQLVCLHRALLAKGHPFGLHVVVMDMDRVSESNIGRQAFYPSDIGMYKATTLVNRANMALDGQAIWTAMTCALTADTNLRDIDLVIGAVDNRNARRCILKALGGDHRTVNAYWLDFGNRSADGQAVLGEVPGTRGAVSDPNRLPHVGELYPELLDPSLDSDDDGPSCSLAEALEKQSLYINQALSVQGMALLWNLLTKGEITVHGVFVSLDHGTTMPLRVDPEQWARFGLKRKSERAPKQAARSKGASTVAA